MKKETGGKTVAPEPSRRKVFGAKSFQLPESDASRLVGNIVEKGVSEVPLRKPIAAPQPTVLPFPVARHRSQGPHWVPKGSENSGGSDVDDDGEDADLVGFNHMSVFANPVQRKQKNDMDFSRWRELISDDNSSEPQRKEGKKHLSQKPKEHKKVTELSETSDKTNDHLHPKNDTTSKRMLSKGNADAGDTCPPSSEELSRNAIGGTSMEIIEDVDPRDVSRKQRRVGTEKLNASASLVAGSSTPNNLVNERGSVGPESEIDAENRARLLRMSTDEIAEAQTEIMEKMNPALIEVLKKRGQEKLKKQKYSGSDNTASGGVNNLHDERIDAKSSPLSERGTSNMVRKAASQDTDSRPDNKAVENLKVGSDNSWDAWSHRVEVVRDIRFSLDGNVIRDDLSVVPNAGNISVHGGYSADNVSERDFLRTDGDPGAAGYTIKEAVALTRSVVPGQRSFALHLLASVFDKALYNFCRDQVGCNIKNVDIDGVIDWEAIWAFALGPEPELVLALRMCLDDNHYSVVLACAKVIQCILSFDLNESIFDLSEKLATSPSEICTAPVFRSKPEIDGGFLHGGFWKYNAKPSNIIPFAEDVMDEDKTEDKHTIQDDVAVAGQDFAAGLVRMGVLPRICYLLESDPSAAMEEYMISILIAIARHSPTCSNAIMKCQRLVQAVVDRFSKKDQMVVHPCKIKSVTLLKVLAQSDKKNCIYFIESGIFRSVTWHLCQYAYSLDQWVKLGAENCKLSSALIVEQLRLWKVCVQYGYCVSYFSDIFPALCVWLSIPTFGNLVENNVLIEFAAITNEAYLVLEALTRRLPDFYSRLHAGSEISEAGEENTETWSWSLVAPMVDLALKWIALRKDPCVSEIFDLERGNKGNLIENSPVCNLLWVVSSVMRMLSGVLERLIPEDITDFSDGHLPWLPEFVPKIGLEIIKNGFLSFLGENNLEDGSFSEYLCYLRHQGKHESSLASVSCLHGLVQVVSSVDKLIQLAKPKVSKIQAPTSRDLASSGEGKILAGGIINSSRVDLRSVLTIFMRLVATDWRLVQSIEIFSRGGPAPGVGAGWGAPGGGFWSPTVLLAQIDARLIISLLQIFQHELDNNNLPAVENTTLSLQMINSALGVCLISGPNDGFVVSKALDILLQVPVLKYLYLIIRRFLTHKEGLKLFGWEYEEEDYRNIIKILASHFKKRWLTVKKKVNAVDSKQKICKVGDVLDTIHEESDSSKQTRQDHLCTSLAVEWAHQKLPLPGPWFLSPISTINNTKQGLNHAREISEFCEVAKGGLFFLLGVEAVSFFLPVEIPSPVRSVSVIWKLHSLSVVLLVGMDVIEEEKSRDVYEILQEVYGQLIDELRFSKNGDFTGEFLKFQSKIHESYSTFVETLVEQLAAESYGDLIYGRQVAVYLHRCVEAPIRLAIWNALSNAHVLELLPSLDCCVAKAEGYLEPVEENDSILEAYVKSWVSGALDRAATRGSVTFTLVLHHISSFIFGHSRDDKLLLRNKLVKTLLRDYSRNRQHEGIMKDLIRYSNKSQPSQKQTVSDEEERRFNLLIEACEENSSLLSEVSKLRASFNTNQAL